MASTSLSSSTHFIGSKVITSESQSRPISVKFRPHRVSAAASTRASSTAERTGSYAPRHIASPASLYEVLGIQMGASCQEIKAAYRRLARVLHPDVAAATSQNENSMAFEFMRVHEAYETLSDPEKRADYDQSLFRRRRPLSSPFAMSGSGVAMSTSASASGFSGYTGRTWETDQCW